MTTKLELGSQVFQELGQEFVSTVFGAAATGRSSVVCGVPGAEGDVPMSRFFLNPFAEGDCAGVDLVGKPSARMYLHKGLRIKSDQISSIFHTLAPCVNTNVSPRNDGRHGSCDILVATMDYLRALGKLGNERF
jgi:hypothetical protein